MNIFLFFCIIPFSIESPFDTASSSTWNVSTSSSNALGGGERNSTTPILYKRDERFAGQVTDDFPHLLGFSRLKAWMNERANPCEDFYEYACGGFIKRYSDFKDLTVMKVMAKSNQLLMKSILSQPVSPLAASLEDKMIFEKTRDYYLSCENKYEIEHRAFSPMIPIANSILEKAHSFKNIPSLFGKLQADGVDVLFRSKFSKVETKDPNDLRLQFFPAAAYEVSPGTVERALQYFVDHRVIHLQKNGLRSISEWVANLEMQNVKFMRKLK